MAHEVLEHVLTSTIDTEVNGNELAIILFEVASTLHKSTTELRRIAIEVSTFSTVLPHLAATLQAQSTARPTDHLIHVLVTVLRNANNVLHSIEEAVTTAKADHAPDTGSSAQADHVRPVLKSAQMTVYRLSLEALRLALVLVNTILTWSSHYTEPQDDKKAKMTTVHDESCAKCAVLSLRASLMQLIVVEKVSSNETAARRLSEERHHAADMLRRIDRKGERRHSSQPRHGHGHGHSREDKPGSPISVVIEELIFTPMSNNLHSTHSWISQSTEHSLLLREWTGVDINPISDSKSNPDLLVSTTAVIAQPAPTADPQQTRKVSLFGKVTKIRSSSASHGSKPDRGRLLSTDKTE